MKISVDIKSFLSLGCDILAVGLFQSKGVKNPFFDQIDERLKRRLSRLIKKEDFKADVANTKLIYTEGLLKARSVLIVGLGDKQKFNLETIRKAGAAIQTQAKQIKAGIVVSEIMGTALRDAPDCAQALVEGWLLNQYRFERYVKKTPESVRQWLLCPGQSRLKANIERAVRLAQTLTEGVYLCRDLVNTPASDMNPLALARAARRLKGVRKRVHNLAAIKKMKMGAFLGVARGSTANPPYFIEMHYQPKARAKKRIAIIGKGVTFDSGGYSIKHAKAMETMKDDMAGAAAVIGLMSIVSRLKPRVAVSGYIAATENMVDGRAQRPGDILRALNGKTIEVLNTDAEGRLTMADALAYANKKKPDYIIDIATLTGSCLVALGTQYTGILGNDQELMDKLIACGNETGEKIWQLPLADEYREELKSQIADLKNIATSPYGGTITAALFLENFVGKTKWAHLDIAGPSFSEKNLPYTPAGGTGVMVRTLAQLLSEF